MLRELYSGKVIPWERSSRPRKEQREILRKIEDEEKYFVSKMSLDDCKRFQDLTGLYSKLISCEEEDIFSYGFAVGTLIMMDVMQEVESMKI